MHVFVTGASGFIGSATVRELLRNGHTVTGLVRTQEKADALAKTGAKPLMGDLNDLETLQHGAANADGVIHTAFVSDWARPHKFPEWCATDRAAIEAMASKMKGSGNALVISSGTLMAKTDGVADEDSPKERNNPPLSDRALSEDLVKKLSNENGIRGIAVRFCPTVHDKDDQGFMAMFIKAARQHGIAAYVGDGKQQWPAVHRQDTARLLRLACERGEGGAVYNAVGEQGVAIKDIFELIGKKVGVPVEGKAHDDPMITRLGFIGMASGMHNPTSSEKTQKALGWKPEEIGLLEDLEANYF